jgi:hypothetical protein
MIAYLLKDRMTGISYLLLLLFNIMIAILACTAIQGSTMMPQTHAERTLRWPLPAAQQWWRQRSSGGGRPLAQHSTIFSMLRQVAAQLTKKMPDWGKGASRPGR